MFTKMNSVWIEDVSQRAEVIKLLKENTSRTLQDNGTAKDFLDKTAPSPAITAKNR